MVDKQLFPAPLPASKFMRREGLEWLSTGENEDYFADEILGISKAEQHEWADASKVGFEALLATAKTLVKEGRWRELGIPHNAQRLVEWSMQHEAEDFLLGRFDFAGGFGDYPVKLLEFNADTCSLIPETAHVQRHLWVEMRRKKGKGPFDPLLQALIRRFKQLLERHPERDATLLLSTLGYEEDVLNVTVLREAAQKAGFQSVYVAELEDVIFDPENGLFVEVGDDEFLTFDFWYKMIPWDFIAAEEPELMLLLTDLVKEDKVKILNPAWTMVLQSKGILPFLSQQYPDEPTILKAGFSSTSFPDGRYARKPIFGRTGENVALYDGEARAAAENDGDYGSMPVVYQDLASFAVDSEGYRYQGSVFYTDQPVALAFRRQDDLIIDDDAEFIAHTIL
ncbi:MAG: glutathionylspermidine synthase family protein [Bacteroidota bacterium]